jgi:hypothetical protein
MYLGVLLKGFVMKPYLTEDSLIEIVLAKFPEARINKGLPGLSKYKPDIVLLDKKLIIEYDGPRHYVEEKVVTGDIKRDKETSALGFSTIRVPYFIQLSEDVISWLKLPFSVNDITQNDFPNGFVTCKKTPKHFCESGLDRFWDEICSMPQNVEAEIMLTLKIRDANDFYFDNNNFFLDARLEPVLTENTQENINSWVEDLEERIFKYTSPNNNTTLKELKEKIKSERNLMYYEEYKRINGKKTFDEFETFIKIFFELTLYAYTGSGTDHSLSREACFCIWCDIVGDVEGDRIFKSVDNIDEYS